MTATAEAIEMARIAARAADEKLATDVVVLDVSEQLVITDCFVIASAANERQVNAIVDNVEEKLRLAGHKPVRREGTREGRWTLLDYVDVVVHIQHDDERNFYALDRLWKDCPVITVDGIGAPAPAGDTGAPAPAGDTGAPAPTGDTGAGAAAGGTTPVPDDAPGDR
ncbi:ribosome silencing factor [Rhodococcus ruber]|uniref:ribosome silencing factor n=1 Tax=Rhodococcus TaxID=1827 RepID=UPI0006616CF4|nr:MULTISPECIES: ribosome silencing factor [Rhodococcus]MCZ1072214.1 ribosome silencing factor [Rhodococcus sp. A5(2022)]NGR06135.1 ribosome silencing factor [bacterium SGD-2]QRE81721.1 ribosome silencing factor [Rhodococcus ruber]UIR38843.1 ribosome silencing factor [Rhodococcus sp. DMF-1]